MGASNSGDTAEIPESLRQRTLSFYLTALLVVAPILSTIPLAWGFVVISLRTGRIWDYSLRGHAVFIFALCEVFFSVFHYQLARLVSDPTPRFGTAAFNEDTQAALHRVLQTGLAELPADGYNQDEETLDLDRPGSRSEAIVQLSPDDPRAADFRNVLRSWFGRAEWHQIRLQQIKEWIYWSLYNRHMPPPDSIHETHRETLDEVLDLLQKRVGGPITAGDTPEVASMRLTLDRVTIYQRPLWWYLAVAVMNHASKMRFTAQYSVRFISHDGVQYFLRVPKTWDPIKGARPIVFLHGLGLGLFQYHRILTNLLETFANRPLLVPIQPHISQDIFHPDFLQPSTRHQTADKLATLLRRLGWVPTKAYDSEDSEAEKNAIRNKTTTKREKGVIIVSHSNGSYTHAWMLKGHPEMVVRSCFVDPVTFCSWEGDVCYNFLYRPCKTGLEVLMRYFVAAELGVANLLHRHFDWSANALWFEEIPNARDPSKTLFLLGGNDSIVNAARVEKYLRSHGVHKGLWIDVDGRHGQALMLGGEGHAKIIEWLNETS